LSFGSVHQRVRVRSAAGLHAATCFGLLTSVMSKIRTPRKRSALTASPTPCVPQSTGRASAPPT
jgi:hypothetical protein